MSIRTILTGTAVTGAVALGTFGLAGVAGAATTTPAASGTTPAHTFTCADAPKALARIAKVDNRIATWLPKAQAREAAATTAGNTAKATKIGNRITKVQGIETKVNGFQAKITAACPGATAAPSTTPTTPAS
jgi:hypothetical protein